MGFITKTEWEYDDECDCVKCLDKRHIIQIECLIKSIKRMENAGVKNPSDMSYKSMYHILDLVKRRIEEGNFPF